MMTCTKATKRMIVDLGLFMYTTRNIASFRVQLQLSHDGLC